jgi:hypothetical protein
VLLARLQSSAELASELIRRIAPTRTEGLNSRGVLSFPIEAYSPQFLTSLVAPKSRAADG